MDDPAFSFDLVAAALRSDARDLEVFLEVLAAKLVTALPGATAVEHEGGLLSRKRVKQLDVQLGEHRYLLARTRGGIEARHSHSVRGITLKTEVLALEHWIDALSHELADHARSSDQARQALDRLLRG